VEVRFQVRKSDKYYLGQVLGIDDDPHCDKGVFRVNFMRPNRKMRNTFVFPVKADIADVEKGQIIKVVGKPIILRRGGFQFSAKDSFPAYNLN
jgi:hypothetical protein